MIGDRYSVLATSMNGGYDSTPTSIRAVEIEGGRIADYDANLGVIQALPGKQLEQLNVVQAV